MKKKNFAPDGKTVQAKKAYTKPTVTVIRIDNVSPIAVSASDYIEVDEEETIDKSEQFL